MVERASTLRYTTSKFGNLSISSLEYDKRLTQKQAAFSHPTQGPGSVIYLAANISGSPVIGVN